MTVRLYGQQPYAAAAVHGGPGAPGSAAGLAEGISEYCGVLEPFQSADTIAGQIRELREQITAFCPGRPIILIGHSWGAWLCAMTAAEYPCLASKLILVAAGPLKTSFVKTIEERRLAHFSGEEKDLYFSLLAKLGEKESGQKDVLLRQLGNLCDKSDAYCELPTPENKSPELNGTMYFKIFSEAAEMRKQGKLLDLFEKIECPICIIHGEYDTHPPEGVTLPLTERKIPYSFHLLPKCGHTPWRETYARGEFLAILRGEIQTVIR